MARWWAETAMRADSRMASTSGRDLYNRMSCNR
jgi:hypothetical protein